MHSHTFPVPRSWDVCYLDTSTASLFPKRCKKQFFVGKDFGTRLEQDPPNESPSSTFAWHWLPPYPARSDAAGRQWWAAESAGMENPSALEASYLRLGISSSHLSEGLPSLSSVFTMISWFPAFALLEGWSPEGWTSARWISCNSSIRLLTSAVTSQGLQRDHYLGRVFLQYTCRTWAAKVGRTNIS